MSVTDVELVFVHICDIYDIITGQPHTALATEATSQRRAGYEVRSSTIDPWFVTDMIISTLLGSSYGDIAGQHQIFQMDFLPPFMYSVHVIHVDNTSITPTAMDIRCIYTVNDMLFPISVLHCI